MSEILANQNLVSAWFALSVDHSLIYQHDGLKADRVTTLRHHRLMCDRIRQTLSTQQNHDLDPKRLLLQQQIQQLSL